MRSRYTIKEPDGPYFLTCTVVQWLPLFTRKPYYDILLDSLRYCRHHKGLKLYAYVIMDNHLHLLVAGDNLTDIIRDFKSYTAKLLIAQLEREQKTQVLNQLQYYKQSTKVRSDYQVWQEGFHPQLIVSEEMLHQKIDYLHHNPVRAGLVAQAEDWLYSSAGDYAGGKGPYGVGCLRIAATNPEVGRIKEFPSRSSGTSRKLSFPSYSLVKIGCLALAGLGQAELGRKIGFRSWSFGTRRKK